MVEFRDSAKLLLFASSYAPLLVIIGVKFWSQPPLALGHLSFRNLSMHVGVSWVTVILFGLAIALYFTLRKVIRYHRGHKTTGIDVDHHRQRNELLSSYLLVYVFAFVSLDATTLQGSVILLFFLVMLAVLQIRSEILHVNPLLGFMGYRVYEVKSGMSTVLLISDVDISERIKTPESVTDEGDYRIDVISLGQNAYLMPPEDD